MLKWLVTGREGGGRGVGDEEGKVTTTDDPLAVLEEGNPNYSQIYSVNRYIQPNITEYSFQRKADEETLKGALDIWFPLTPIVTSKDDVLQM